MLNQSTIIIDCNYLGHAARFAMDKKLSTSTGIRTHVIFGFLKTVINLGMSFDTSDLVFVWDSKKSIRKQMFPGYKEKRHKDETPEERAEMDSAYHQFKILEKKIIPAMGFKNNFIADGYEGDDLIASIIENNPRVPNFMIYASDKDLYQLLSNNVCMIKQRQTYTIKSFVKEYGISPAQWHLVKALAGCTSDEVPGIAGVGEITACKYIRNELKPTAKVLQRIKDEEEQVKKFNIPLVKLPLVGTPEIKLVKNEFNPDKAKELFRYFEFRQFIDEWDDWSELLK